MKIVFQNFEMSKCTAGASLSTVGSCKELAKDGIGNITPGNDDDNGLAKGLSEVVLKSESLQQEGEASDPRGFGDDSFVVQQDGHCMPKVVVGNRVQQIDIVLCAEQGMVSRFACTKSIGNRIDPIDLNNATLLDRLNHRIGTFGSDADHPNGTGRLRS